MQLAQGWSVAVERGPDWLFITLHCDEPSQSQAEPADLAENLWELGQCHLVNRIVLDLHELPRLDSVTLEEVARLSTRLHNAKGVLRLCGVDEEGEDAIRAAKLERLFPCYADRSAAVRGERPRQPR